VNNPRFIPMATPVLGDREIEYVSDAVRSGWISFQGKYVDEFEKAFSQYCGVRHGIAVSSCTSALHLALAVLGVGPGDEVIIPGITHIAVPNAVTLTGGKIVLADCEAVTWNIDPNKIAEKLTSRTKCVVVVHLYGHPVNMDPIIELSKKHGFYIVEDAAEAHGAEYKGRKTGGLGHIGCFSFFANKIITTGEGGMIVTDDARLATKARKLGNQAYEQERRFLHRELGFHYRMTNMQAAIGVAQMQHIDTFVNTRRRNAQLYNELLRGITGLVLPPEAEWAKSVYWMYSVLIEDSFGMQADDFRTYLKGRGIEARPFFYPMHLQPLYAAQFSGEAYPETERLGRRGVNLPSGNELTAADVRVVVDAIKSGRQEKS
jgi:perosamine synthetase